MIAWLKNKLSHSELTDEKAMRLTAQAQQMIRASLPPFMFSTLSDNQPSRYADYLRQYTVWVYVCASKNASAIASVPLRLYAATGRAGVRKGVRSRPISRNQLDYLQTKSHLGSQVTNADNIEEITDHPWLTLIREVNAFYNGFEMIELVALYLELTGNAYWLMVRDRQSPPTELWPLPSHLMNIKRNPTFGIEHYQFGAQPPYQLYDPETIVHFRYPNPLDPFYGMGPLEASQLPVALNNKFDQYENAILDNGAVIPFFFGTDKELNDASTKKLRADIDAVHKGFKKAGRFGFLWGGLKPFSVGSKPKDVNYEVGQKQTMHKISGAFGVPVSLLMTEDVNLANARIGLEQYMRFTILPKLKRIEQTINQDVMGLYDPKLFVAFDNPVPEDREAQLRENDIRLKNWSMTINEWRSTLGEEEVPWGDQPLVQGDVKPMDMILNPPEPVVMPDIPAVPAEDDEPEEAHLESFSTKVQSPRASGRLESAAARWLSTITIVSAQAVSAIDIHSDLDINALIPWPELKQQGEELMESELTSVLHSGARKGVQRMQQVGLRAAEWSTVNPSAVEWAKQQVGKRITLIADETRSAIRHVVAESIRQGRTTIELRNDIRTMVGLNRKQAAALDNFRLKLEAMGAKDFTIRAAMSEYRVKLIKQRAEMIARTETASAWAEGNLQAYRENGVSKKEFSAASDACPICSPLDGKVLPIGSEEINIPLHPSCLLPDQKVVAPDIKGAMQSNYHGPALEIKFSNGTRLSVTIDHLFLTQQGFVLARELRQGDDVLYCRRFERRTGRNPDNDWQPALIDQIVKTLAMSSSMSTVSVPVSSEHLHGDGVFCEGNINIVFPDGFLLIDTYSSDLQFVRNGNFKHADSGLIQFAGPSSLTQSFKRWANAADGIVGRDRQSLSLIGAEMAHSDFIRFGSTSRRYTRPQQSFPDRTSIHAKMVGERQFALSGAISVTNGNIVKPESHLFGQGSGDNAKFSQPVSDRFALNSDGLADAITGFSGVITPLDIIDIKCFHYSGPVYDLQTEGSLYLAEGIVSSNCRCDWLPVVE